MRSGRRFHRGLLLTTLFLWLFTACAQATPPIIPSPVIVLSTPTPLSISTPALAITSVVILPPTLTPAAPPEQRIGSAVPSHLRAQVEALSLPPGTLLTLDVSPQTQPAVPGATQIRWLYALAAPFPTVRDGVTLDEIRAAWTGESTQALLMAESTRGAITALWGEPDPGSVRSVDEGQLQDAAWAEDAWAIVPFERLSPRWKVLTIDGQSPIRKGFDASSYPLVVSFTLQASPPLDPSTFNLQLSNYDSSKLTTVILTGVTALVRATAYRMEQKGITYPGRDLRDILREADLAHISNEISFFTGCPFPNPNSQRLIFCSDPKYMELLLDVGMDVVEMTGNHFADYGSAAARETIAIYQANNIPYFGGGSDLQDSFEPALFEVNGNKIAFLGCNRPDVDGPKVATETRPGATPCDFDALTAKVFELKDAGYLVIFTFQWYEDYGPLPGLNQDDDFRRVADAGATIVSGSQAHFPKVMEFYNDSFIHYGLGNLFFDQMGNQNWMPEGIRREFIDRYVIYDGRLVSVELITAMLEDFSRPRPMTNEERAAFLREYFIHSGWVTEAGTSVP